MNVLVNAGFLFVSQSDLNKLRYKLNKNFAKNAGALGAIGELFKFDERHRPETSYIFLLGGSGIFLCYSNRKLFQENSY